MRVELGRVDDGVDLVDDLGGAVVAVGDRLGEQPAVGVEEAVVDAPRVDADRLGVGDPWPGRRAPLRYEVGEVPAQVPVDARRRRWGSGGRPRVGRPVAVDDAGHDPAAGRADVDGGEDAARSAEEGGGDAGVDGDEQAGGVAELVGAERGDGVGDVLGQHLALEQGALRVERAELVLGDAVDGGPLGAPAAGEDAAAADDAVGVDAVDADAVLAELGGEQADLVGLVGLGGAVGDVVRARRTARSWRRCRRCRRRGAGRSSPVAAAWATRKLPLAITSCWRSQSCLGRLEQRLGDREPGVVDDEVDAAEGEQRGVDGGPHGGARR